MLMKWLNGNVRFFEELPLCFAVCTFMCFGVMLEREESVLTLTSWLFFNSPGEEVQSHNNDFLSSWKEMERLGWFFFGGGEGGVAGVYLSHGNWFAGVEVGSFEKTSFSLTPSHLSAWKAAGRGWWRSAAAEAFSYRKCVRTSEGTIRCSYEIKDAFCIFTNSAFFFTPLPSSHDAWCFLHACDEKWYICLTEHHQDLLIPRGSFRYKDLWETLLCSMSTTLLLLRLQSLAA